MPLNHGEIIERIIRRNNYPISAIAKLLNVNRRSVYNWFNLPTLRTDIIYQIGHAIKHDFSKEFPELFTPEDFNFESKSSIVAKKQLDIEVEKELIYKEKYLELLERFNKLVEDKLSKEAS
jgi:hypothetical protein